MKHLEANAHATVAASAERCFALLENVADYPRWARAVVREATVLETDGSGSPVTACAVLHVAQSRFGRDFGLTLAITLEPGRAVYLTRVPHDADDPERLEIAWRIDPSPQTRIELHLSADLSLPGFVPLGGVGDSIARGLVEAAAEELGH